MSWFDEQCERCRACRYRNRGALDAPCSIGLFMIAYSRKCSAYKPSIMTRIRETIGWLRKAIKEDKSDE